MNAIAKVLAPAALVLASFSASAAGLVETDYPFDAPAAAQAAATATAPAAGQPFTGLDIHYPGDNAAVSGDHQRTRAEARSEIGQTGAFVPFGPAHNA